jgi:hypothetical protein
MSATILPITQRELVALRTVLRRCTTCGAELPVAYREYRDGWILRCQPCVFEDAKVKGWWPR